MQHEFEDREINLPIVCEYDYSPSTPPTSSWNCPMGEPGDPEECTLNQVLLMLPREQIEKALAESKGPFVGIDIISILVEGEVAYLEDDLIEKAREAYENRGGEPDDRE